jgi:hypothetical protein
MQRILPYKEILLSITEQLCITNNWNTHKIKFDTHSLVLTNKALHAYYAAENTSKEIIRKIGLHTNRDDLTIAKLLCRTIIADKIENLFGKPPKYALNFCHNDLNDRWYLNTTSTFPGVEPEQQTLLLRAIEFIDISKVMMLLNAKKMDLQSNRCENPLRLSLRRYFCANEQQEKTDLFSIVTLLLEKKFDPDVIITMKQREITPLMQTALTGDQKLARLLMEYGANPYETIIVHQDEKDSKNNVLINCFQLEQSVTFPFITKGWLKTMHHEIMESYQ